MNGQEIMRRVAPLLDASRAAVLRLPLQVRVGAPAALVVGLTILWNAVADQRPRDPSTLLISTRAGTAPPAPDAAMVRQIQTSLRDLELYGGPIDGVPGPGTTAAIRRFERAAGRAETGAAEPDLLSDLMERAETGRDEAATAVAATPASLSSLAAPSSPEPGLPVDAAVIAEVQAALNGRPFRLVPDGKFGPATRRAIMAFQEEIGAEQTGAIDEALLEALRGPAAARATPDPSDVTGPDDSEPDDDPSDQ